MKLIKKIFMLLSIVTIIFLGVNYVFYESNEKNAMISSKIYKNGAINPAFEDVNFYKCVVDGYNEKNGTIVSYTTILNDEQLSSVERLHCTAKNKKDSEKIVSVKGIEKLSSLNYMFLPYHLISEIDLSANLNLDTVILFDNKINEIDISNNSKLTYLSVSGNLIKSLNVKNNLLLEHLDVSRTLIEELDLSANLELTFLSVGESKLLELDISNNPKLSSVSATSGILKKINTNGAISLSSLAISCNQLTELDMSSNINLSSNFIHTNPYSKTVYAYKNTQSELELPVKYPDKYTVTIFDNMVWNSNDELIARVEENKEIIFGNSGETTLNGVTKQYQWGEMHDVTIDLYVHVVEITSSDYVIDEDKNFIYISKDNDVETIKNKINISHKEVVIDINLDFNELYVKYKDVILKTYKLLSIDLGILKLFDNKYILNEMSYDEFVRNITMCDELKYKIYNEDVEVINPFITSGMELRIYYNDEIIYTYKITDDYLEFDSSIKNDDVNKYLLDVDIDTSVKMMLNLINTTGKITITDNKNQIITDDRIVGTGSKIIIELSSKIIEYYVIISGDIDGDGRLALGDIMKVAKYVYQDKDSLSGVYSLAADYNPDEIYNLQDIMKLANKIYGGVN